MQQKLEEKHYGSVFYDEQELLSAIIKIHCPIGIQLDPMYNKGMFYKKSIIDKPRFMFDIEPQIDGVIKADATNLPLEDSSVKTMILDPPFLFGIHGKTEENVCSKRYTIIKDFSELKKLYKGIIKEAYRVLKPNGILIFKCQDYTDSKTIMTHCLVFNWAFEQNFYAKDLCLLVKPNKIFNPNTTQRHFRKVHSYFWIFKNKLG